MREWMILKFERLRRAISAPTLVLILGALLTPEMAAQDADFLFKRPTVTLGVRLGYALPRAGSEIFDFTRTELTVEKRDFNALSLGGEFGVRVTDRLDLAVGLGIETSKTRSEFREFVDNNDLPIEQDTKFTRVPLTVGVKAYLLERGRSISRLAWVPNRWAPYVTGGAGFVWYTFEQTGDFVDFDTFEIFFDRFDSKGSSPLAYLGAGSDFSIGPKWLLNGEVRYSWASAGMDRDFVGFDDIDLTGVKATVGVSVRF